MRFQLIGLIAATATLVAGCGLTGTESNEPSARSGRITIGDKSLPTSAVKCSQSEWLLSIDATADPGRAQASLQLGGDKPKVQTVNIENIDGLGGVSGGDVGKADATLAGDIYVITGTAVGTDTDRPGQTRDLPFKIEAPC